MRGPSVLGRERREVDTRDCVGLGTFPTRLHLLLPFLRVPVSVRYIRHVCLGLNSKIPPAFGEARKSRGPVW